MKPALKREWMTTSANRSMPSPWSRPSSTLERLAFHPGESSPPPLDYQAALHNCNGDQAFLHEIIGDFESQATGQLR